MRQYATFSGRTTRSDFWIFTFVLLAMLVVAAILDAVMGGTARKTSLFFGLTGLVHTLPQIAINVRRLHDTDRSGWWMLLWFTGLGALVVGVFLLLPGTRGANSFGPSPVNWPAAEEDPVSGPPPVAIKPVGRVSTSANIIGEMERLSQLRIDGSLSDAEFESAKARLLSRGG